MSVRLIIVDDHPIVRAGIRAVVEARGFEVLAEVGTGEEAVDATRELRPDVVLCDLRLGEGMDGVATTAALRALPHPPAVLILTTFDHDAQIVRAVEAGAAGYLLKEVGIEVISRAIVDAAAGAAVPTPGGDERLVAALRAPRVELTSREQEVLALVAEGLSNREIATRLFVAEATVKTHIVHLLDKLSADSRTGAVSEARRRGLL
ncbi:response regulator [Microbacterium azadirachtae]|uniref:Response regulator protein VraR n=1 Tax=Microbacterium azadirachtae TaxID=582680 RepID=A0A0F0L2H4_9MICO|nr:response regulator transcription factor [Microbacterium azadirachtae]KJL26894.1 Response regulator protein VraR [Microbacterium azadirachtae]UXW85124.1 response regulator transcription factor [Microbacterium azadirachtae]SDM07941.1 DNA-binding response regulator, NarL/FixJ family, contains REC and HTH domains [Microbacterium azadirachtae]SEG32996.1 DNA-binding response regulator, NarL/FixJ family, contains REC and HTH domains [Microbacterium azadirachtae]SEG36121.1 DNA-binding response regu